MKPDRPVKKMNNPPKNQSMHMIVIPVGRFGWGSVAVADVVVGEIDFVVLNFSPHVSDVSHLSRLGVDILSNWS